MKLDIHTHILPQSLPDLKERYGYGGWINIRPDKADPSVANMYKDDQFFRKIEKNCWCLSERVTDMRKTNVTAQVLSTVPVMFSYWAKPEHTSDLARLINDDMASQVREHQNSSRLECTNGCSTEEKIFYGFGI